MSYYIYKKKQFIEVQGEKIMPLVLYADSSIRDCDTGRHPAYWWLNDITGGGRLLIPKVEFENARKEMLEKELVRLNEYYSKYDEKDKLPAGMDSYLYSGNSYPGGRRVKNMYYFYSTRNTISPDDFFRRNRTGFSISASYYDRTDFQTIQTQNYHVRSETDMLEADRCYQEFYQNKPEHYGMCLDVTGIWIQ